MSEWRNTELASGSPVVRQTTTASDTGHKGFTCRTGTTTNYSYGLWVDSIVTTVAMRGNLKQHSKVVPVLSLIIIVLPNITGSLGQAQLVLVL